MNESRRGTWSGAEEAAVAVMLRMDDFSDPFAADAARAWMFAASPLVADVAAFVSSAAPVAVAAVAVKTTAELPLV